MNTSVLASMSVRCLGAQGNSDISVELYKVVDSVLATQNLPTVNIVSRNVIMCNTIAGFLITGHL